MWAEIFAKFVTDDVALVVHIYLLGGDVLATIAVGAGIVWEHGPPEVRVIANRLVIWGIVAETLCSVALFAFDEGIGGAQQATIAAQQVSISSQQHDIIALQKSNGALMSQGQENEALATRARREAAQATERAAQLEKDAAVARAAIAEANARAAEASQKAAEAELALEKLKTPRTLGQSRQQAVANAIRPFAGQRYRAAISQGADDGVAFWESLYVTLQSAGWIYVPTGPPSMGDPPAGIPIAAIPGVEIRFDPAKEQELIPAVLALGNALHTDGMVVAVNRERASNPTEADRNIVLIVIGARVSPQ